VKEEEKKLEQSQSEEKKVEDPKPEPVILV
jgi:hypothetical protein